MRGPVKREQLVRAETNFSGALAAQYGWTNMQAHAQPRAHTTVHIHKGGAPTQIPEIGGARGEGERRGERGERWRGGGWGGESGIAMSGATTLKH